MISGFRKNTKRTNIRRKITTLGSDDEEGQIENDTSPTILPVTTEPTVVEPIPIKIKTKKSSSKTSLSFGDELDKEDEFILKRSKASLTLQEQIKREKKRKKKKENMIEIKPVIYEEPIVLTQTEIPFSTNGVEIKTFDDDEPSFDDVKPVEENYISASHRFSVRMKPQLPGDIPDAAMIYQMKKKREQARMFSGQVNYIPLDTNKHEGRFKTGSSRLIREEMDDSSDDERMEMKGSCDLSHPALERRKQVAKALEDVEDEHEKEDTQDDELQRWEDEQMKKGSKIPTNQAITLHVPKQPKQTKSIIGTMLMDINTTYGGSMVLPTTTNNIYSALLPSTFPPQVYAANYSTTPLPVAQQQVVTVDFVKNRLTEQLDTKKQSLALRQQNRNKIKEQLDMSKETIVTLQRKAVDVSDRFTFYQDIRGFIKDLIECLQEKVKKINELEEAMHLILKKRAEKLISRQMNDVKDEIDQISGKTNTESERISNIKNRRIAEREGRRARRRESRREKGETTPHNEGMSSDEEMITSENLRFDADKGKVIKECESLFEDVVEEFTSISEVMNRFEQWKFAFSDSYKEAFLGICLPKLFTPYIKLELLDWNLLEDDSTDFEDFDWYTALVLYGYHEGELDEQDEDIKLLPNVIEKVLIPKITALVRDVWDPLSSKQTKIITFFFQRLVDDYPTITKESKTTQTLVETIVSRINQAVENEIYIPLYSREMLDAKNSHALCFLERQFWKGVKLLQNLMEWNWLLSQKKLLQLGIDAILNRYLIIALQQFPDSVSSLEKAKTIVNILPKEWFKKSDKMVVGMKSFARCLNGLAANVYKSSLGYTDIEQKKHKITIKKIISLLMHIQAFDEARLIANTYTFRKDKDSPAATPGSAIT